MNSLREHFWKAKMLNADSGTQNGMTKTVQLLNDLLTVLTIKSLLCLVVTQTKMLPVLAATH